MKSAIFLRSFGVRILYSYSTEKADEISDEITIDLRPSLLYMPAKMAGLRKSCHT